MPGSTDFGKAVWDSTNREVVIDVSIAESESGLISAFQLPNPENLWNPSGVWRIYKSDIQDGAIHENACDAGTECKGLRQHDYLGLLRLSGNEFTPDATCVAGVEDESFDPDNDTCGGTVGDRAYGLTVWTGQPAFEACGSKLGMTNEWAKANGKLDLTAAFDAGEITEGRFDWSTEVQMYKIVRCESWGWAYAECDVGTNFDRIEVHNLHYKCTYDGVDRFGKKTDTRMWVDGGCRADFKVYSSPFGETVTLTDGWKIAEAVAPADMDGAAEGDPCSDRGRVDGAPGVLFHSPAITP